MLISEPYRKTLRTMHRKKWGNRGDKWAPQVVDLIYEHRIGSVLDYGCGKGTLISHLERHSELSGLRLNEYDPAIPGKDVMPDPAELVVCTDVLEHVEPDCIGPVLKHLHLLARPHLFAVIATKEAIRTLPDGRNAHILLKSAEWWCRALHQAGFAHSSFRVTHKELIWTGKALTVEEQARIVKG